MKKGILAIIAVLLIFMGLTGTAAANTNPGIRIDGQLRVFNPSCQIVNQRTMVPLRFVIEDNALKGSVAWNGSTGKVTVQCRGKNFEFVIGSSRVMINGTAYYLDAPPYIYQNRTYLPLRFLAENLDGIVSWSSALNEVRISFNKSAHNEKPAVFGYYYAGGFQELKENAPLFSDVALRWFETDANGNLFYEYQDNYGQVLDFLRSKGIKTHASVMFMDKAGLHTLLANPQLRAKLIDQLYNEVQKNNYDGVDIDFEFISSSDTNYFTIFLQELKDRLGSNKELSAAVFARTSTDNWPTGYDYKAIGQIVDKMVVMTYDYHYKTSAPGPIAPLWWVNNVINYMISTAHIPASKLLLGVATYGYNWGSGLNTTTVTLNNLNSIKSSYRVTEHFDYASMSPYYTYTDGNGIAHQIWLENKLSLNEKWNAAVDNNLGGISFWRIGNGFADLYSLLEEKLVQY